MQNKTIIEIPAGGFYVYNPKKQPDVIPTSDGAFGCCYLTIKDGDNILVAHINATSIMLDSVAKQTVQNMLTAFKKAGGKIENAETIIVHSNDPQEYEKGFQNRPKDLTPDQKKPRGHYTEKFDANDFSFFVTEPFAHFALYNVLKKEGVDGIKLNKKFNTNLGEFMQNPEIKPINTDIIIGSDGETYLRNFDNNTGFAKFSENGAEAIFKDVARIADDKTTVKISPQWNEIPPIGKFYANVANDIKNGLISVENSIGTTKEGCNDYSQFAAMDMNKYVENKLAPQTEPIQTSFIQQPEPNFQKPTISSIMKMEDTPKHKSALQGIVMSNPKKIDRTFVDALENRNEQQNKTKPNVPNK